MQKLTEFLPALKQQGFLPSYRDWGLVLPSDGGKYKYIFYPFKVPNVGERCLIYPAHSRRYYLLKLAQPAEGDKIIAITDKKGNSWGVAGN